MMTEPSNESPRSNDRAPKIAEGTYRARPVRYGLTRNPESGNFSFAVEFEMTDRRQITWYGALKTNDTNGNGSAWDVTEKALRAMGWEGDDIREAKLSRVVNITIAHETYEGRASAKVVSVRGSVVDMNAVDSRDAEEIAETLRAASASRR